MNHTRHRLFARAIALTALVLHFAGGCATQTPPRRTLPSDTPVSGEARHWADRIEQTIADAFADASGQVLDYRPTGAGEMPDAQNAIAGRPNAFSWWTPVENATLLTAVHVAAALADGTRPASPSQVQRWSEPLSRAASLDPPGFVARYVFPDGRTSYPFGSEDQTGPWLVAMWQLISTLPADSDVRRALAARYVAVTTALRDNGWRMPVAARPWLRAGQTWGSFSEDEARGWIRRLFALRTSLALTGDAAWRDDYERSFDRHAGSAARVDLASAALWSEAERGRQEGWLLAPLQAMLETLRQLETDAARRARFDAGIRRLAGFAATQAHATAAFDRSALERPWTPFDVRTTEAPQRDGDAAYALAIRQLQGWKNPRRQAELSLVREPFAWYAIAARLACDAPGGAGLLPAALERAREVDWDRLASSSGVYAVLALRQLALREDRCAPRASRPAAGRPRTDPAR